MTIDYTHEMNTEIRSISGGYEFDTEGVIELDGREVLYVVGNAVADSACCGFWGCRYALVPGVLVRRHYTVSDNGAPISEVEPVTDPTLQKRLTKLLEQQEGAGQVRFL